MDIATAIIDLLRLRAATASVCPSEVARALALEADEAAWRALMQPVRDAAATLARAGQIIITQKDHQVDPDAINDGPVRLRRGPSFPPL